MIQNLSFRDDLSRNSLDVTHRRELTLHYSLLIYNYCNLNGLIIFGKEIALFSASLADHVLYGKSLCPSYSIKIPHHIELSFDKTIKKPALLSHKMWIGHYTPELRSYVLKHPDSLLSGIHLTTNYSYSPLVTDETKHTEILNELNRITMELLGQKLIITSLLHKRIDYMLFYLSVPLLKVSKSLGKLLKYCKSIAFSHPFDSSTYFLRSILPKYSVDSILLDHSGVTFDIGTTDDYIRYLYWLGLDGNIYPITEDNKGLRSFTYSTPFQLEIDKLKNLYSNYRSTLLSSKVSFPLIKSNHIAFALFPFGDDISYPHYQCDSDFQIVIMKKLFVFLKHLACHYKLSLCFHPSTTIKHIKWIKNCLPNKKINWVHGNFDKHIDSFDIIYFTYSYTSTFYSALCSNKKIFYISFCPAEGPTISINYSMNRIYSKIEIPIEYDSGKVSSYLENYFTQYPTFL